MTKFDPTAIPTIFLMQQLDAGLLLIMSRHLDQVKAFISDLLPGWWASVYRARKTPQSPLSRQAAGSETQAQRLLEVAQGGAAGTRILCSVTHQLNDGTFIVFPFLVWWSSRRRPEPPDVRPRF